jgi:hypothetical protein
VVDGRDARLATTAFHAVHDALEAGRLLDESRLAEHVCKRFTASTDLS